MNLQFEKLLQDVDQLFEGKTKKDEPMTKSDARWKDFGGKAGAMSNKKDKERGKSGRSKAKQDLKKELNESAKKKKLKDACWDGYEAVGKKKKNGKSVPNCVKKEARTLKGAFELLGEGGQCDGPTQKTSSTSKGKKWMQCVKNPDGKGHKRVHWGQKGVRVTGKSGDTKRKKSFRARHKCSSAKAGTANYQSCKDW